MITESIPRILLEHDPDLSAIAAAIEEFKAHIPITQKSAKTGQPMTVQEDKELGVLMVICDGQVVYRSRVANSLH